jgi:hypothetical protein
MNEGNFNPFIQGGQNAFGTLQGLTGTNPGGNPLTAALTAPFNPSDLANTPGYQFTLNQGLEATQNGFAAQGLGSSGAAEKGAANYAEGLAGTTYNQQLQNYLQQNQQIYNMIMGQSNLGLSAAGALGNVSSALGSGIANSLTGIGQAQAAGTIGQANAYGGILNGLGGDILGGYFAANSPLFGGSGGGSGSYSPYAAGGLSNYYLAQGTNGLNPGYNNPIQISALGGPG